MATRDELDELFGDEGARPRPRVALVVTLVLLGVAMAVTGLACTAVPGAAVLLAAWAVARKERDRVESGYLPADADRTTRGLVIATSGALLLAVAVLVTQTTLLGLGVYDLLGGELIDRFSAPPTP